MKVVKNFKYRKEEGYIYIYTHKQTLWHKQQMKGNVGGYPSGNYMFFTLLC